jgi:hypothetical protein
MKHTLLLLSVIATQAHAQIIYTDVIPDATYTGTNDTCSLDLNNDGNIDFLIVRGTVQAPCPSSCNASGTQTRPRRWVRITPQGTNAVANSGSFVAQLPQGQVIEPGLTWNNASEQDLVLQSVPYCRPWQPGQLVCAPGGQHTGSWSSSASEDSSKFLGLRFESAGTTYYGWARLSIPWGNVATRGEIFTLKDYAYNSVPGEGILAGDMGSITTGITSTALRGMQLAPNPFTSVLSIALPTGTTGTVLCRVLSLTGQELLARTVAAAGGPSAITLDLASLAPGTYLLEMQVDGERMVRKVVKE